MSTNSQNKFSIQFNFFYFNITNVPSLFIFLILFQTAYQAPMLPQSCFEVVEKKQVELFIMSKCPYGSFTVLDFQEVINQIGNLFDLSLKFIVQDDGTPPYGYSSLHGVSEIEGDIYELCAIREYPSSYFNFSVCLASNYNKIPSNVQICANISNLDYVKLQKCFQNDYNSVLHESAQATLQNQVSASPTVFIEGIRFIGSENASFWIDAICSSPYAVDNSLFGSELYSILIGVGASICVYLFTCSMVLLYLYIKTRKPKVKSHIVEEAPLLNQVDENIES